MPIKLFLRKNIFKKNMKNFCKAIGLLFSQKLSRLKKCNFFKKQHSSLKTKLNSSFSDYINANKTVFKKKIF